MTRAYHRRTRPGDSKLSSADKRDWDAYTDLMAAAPGIPMRSAAERLGVDLRILQKLKARVVACHREADSG